MALFIPTAAMGPTSSAASLHVNPFGMDATSTAVLTEHLIESTTNWIHHHQQQRQQQQQHQSMPGAHYQFSGLHGVSHHRHVSRHNPLHASNHLHHHHRGLHSSRQLRRLSNHAIGHLQSNQRQQSPPSPSTSSSSHNHQQQQSNSLSSDSIVQLVNPSNMPSPNSLTLLVATSAIDTSGNVHCDLPSSSPSSISSCPSPACDAVVNNVLLTALSRYDAQPAVSPSAGAGAAHPCIHLTSNVPSGSVVSSGASVDGTCLRSKSEFVDLHKGKPIRLKVKVLIPVDDHPNFNFVGKLLGPKGQSLKWLQEQTQTKMTILGKGSMRDKQKEEELRSDVDPKYYHLREDLHVEITAFASAHEAYSRIGHALAQIKRFLVPDYYDDIRQQQLKELGIILPERKSVSSTAVASTTGGPTGNNNLSGHSVSSPSSSSHCDAGSVGGGDFAISSDTMLPSVSHASSCKVTSVSGVEMKSVLSNENVATIGCSHHDETFFRASAHHHHHIQGCQCRQEQQQPSSSCHHHQSEHLCHHGDGHATSGNQVSRESTASHVTARGESSTVTSQHHQQQFTCSCEGRRLETVCTSPLPVNVSPISSTSNIFEVCPSTSQCTSVGSWHHSCPSVAS